MIKAPIPANEDKRLQKLKSYNILDTPSENDYDELVQLASQICETPISLMTLVDEDRQWFKSKVGLEVPESSREISFCGHAIHEEEVFLIEDATKDLRFQDNPLVTADPNIQFYAGVPLKTPDGFNIGTLCIIDHKPRKLNQVQLNALKVLARQIVNHLELRLQVNEIKNAYSDLYEERESYYKANKIYQRLLSIVSHDVRGPLNSFIQLVEMLINNEMDIEQFKSLAPNFQKNMKTTVSLLDTIVKWGTEKMENKENKYSIFELYTITDRVMSNFITAATLKNIQLVNNVPKDVFINTDENILRFILRNLVSNAVKFTEKGYIEINALDNQEYTEISVKDTGIGMSPDLVSKIFKWDSSKSRMGTNNESGSGLGLSVIHEFLVQLNADIHVDTEINKGSTFRIRLPKQKNL